MNDEIQFEKKNGLGLITLNRPKALNALNASMLNRMHERLIEWETDDSVLAVLVQGAGDKAFCAGGDIRSVFESLNSGSDHHTHFFHDEYALNEYIYSYPKPYIALMHGYTMGGGMGIAQGASFRVLTERSKVAMPEVAIGYFPDVGASHFLTQCPGSIGNYLAVTGVTLDSEDALYAKLGDWILPSSETGYFRAALEQLDPQLDITGQIAQILLQLGARTNPLNSELEMKQKTLDLIFSLTTVQQIIAELEQRKSMEASWIGEILELMKKRSPLGMVGALESIRYGKRLSIVECFKMENAMSECWLPLGEFEEGIRALIIDKDQSPQWVFTLSELTPEKMQDLFPFLNQYRHALTNDN
jgi:enoyl-CoA hydratase/carnithine racemase